MLFEEGNAFNMCFRPQGYRKCMKMFCRQHCLPTKLLLIYKDIQLECFHFAFPTEWDRLYQQQLLKHRYPHQQQRSKAVLSETCCCWGRSTVTDKSQFFVVIKSMSLAFRSSAAWLLITTTKSIQLFNMYQLDKTFKRLFVSTLTTKQRSQQAHFTQDLSLIIKSWQESKKLIK